MLKKFSHLDLSTYVRTVHDWLSWNKRFWYLCLQGLHSLEKYLNLEGFLEKALKIESALKSTGKSLKSLVKYLNSTSFCRT